MFLCPSCPNLPVVLRVRYGKQHPFSPAFTTVCTSMRFLNLVSSTPYHVCIQYNCAYQGQARDAITQSAYKCEVTSDHNSK